MNDSRVAPSGTLHPRGPGPGTLLRAGHGTPAVRVRLRSTALLSGLPDPIVDEFLAAADLLDLRPRDVLFRVGESGDLCFVVVSGKVKVTRPSEDGKDNVFTIAGAGDLLGELSMFDGELRRATATVISDAVIARLRNEVVRGWLERHPEASTRFMRLLIARVRQQNDALDDVYGLDVGTRLARALVRLGARFGRRTVDGLRIELGMSQEELAQHVRASRESVNQVLSSFTRSGWIRRDGSDIVIVDEAAVLKRAHSTQPDQPTGRSATR